MEPQDGRARLGREDWVKAGLRALVDGGIMAVRVEPLAREIGATKGSFYWHFRDLADLHQAMLELWEEVATHAITRAVRASGRDARGQLDLLIALASAPPGPTFGGAAIEPALRDWGRSDPRARAAVERVDRQRLADVQGFLRDAGLAEAEVTPNAHLIYAAVIGFETLRLTTAVDMHEGLRRLVARLFGQGGG